MTNGSDDSVCHRCNGRKRRKAFEHGSNACKSTNSKKFKNNFNFKIYLLKKFVIVNLAYSSGDIVQNY